MALKMSEHLHAAFSEHPWALRGAHLLLPGGIRGVVRRVEGPPPGEEVCCTSLIFGCPMGAGSL